VKGLKLRAMGILLTLFDDLCDQPLSIIGSAYPVPHPDAEHLQFLFSGINENLYWDLINFFMSRVDQF
jgi:hypothetical protein